MGLSDAEKKVLEELERGLYAEDAGFANRVKSANAKTKKSSNSGNPAAKLVAGSVLAVAGLSVLIMGVVIQVPVIGVVGFLLMLVGLIMGSSNWSNSSLKTKANSSTSKGSKSAKNIFEERWDRRFDK